jgi:hypothetical protein
MKYFILCETIFQQHAKRQTLPLYDNFMKRTHYKYTTEQKRDISWIVQMELTEVGENLAILSVKHNKMRDATSTVCKALESLCLEVITANITTIVGGITHTMFFEVNINALFPLPIQLI